jgi:membrane-bound serine protease (ClpP class)
MDRDSILAALRDPSRAWIVILIGVVLVYREFAAPGRVLPGIFGAVGVCLGFYSLLRHPWHGAALAMIAAALALLILQVFRHWFWLPLAAGAAFLTFGVHTLTEPRIGLVPALGAIPLSIITVFLLRTALLARRNKVSLE